MRRTLDMEKLVVASDLADVVDFTAPVETNLQSIAAHRGLAVEDLTVCILDRPRHEQGLVKEVRRAGARITFILDGDVAGAIMAAEPSTGVDVMIGIGGTPEGVLAACALKCLGGAFFGRLYPRNDDERRLAQDAGYDPDRILNTDDMVSSNNVFVAATGVTDGELLRGVRYSPDRATTHSLSMRSLSGAVRTIETRHRMSTSNLVVRPSGERVRA
jgi:fructose-1,6-bisphosphatase II